MPRVVPPIEVRPSDARVSSSVVETVAGFTAGVVTTLAVHPFDVVKTRLQVDRYSRLHVGSSVHIAKSVYRDEGGAKAFYRGLVPNMVGNSVSWALYFLWYGEVKNIIAHYRHSGPGSQLASSDYFLASGAAGVLTAILTNPIWVIKTRMLTSSASSKGAYTGIRHGTKHIWQTEGFFGFYRGLAPSLIGVSHGAIQFMCYEQFKNWRTSAKEADPGRNRAGLSNFDYLTLSAASKMFAGTITYPYQVLRTRLQTYDAVGTVRSVVRDVWTQEGMRGFYKGLGPNLLRVVPSTCVTFLTYENVKVYFPRLYHNESLFDD